MPFSVVQIQSPWLVGCLNMDEDISAAVPGNPE
jgi:hypothetical protein